MEKKEAPVLGSYSILKELKKDAWGVIYEALKAKGEQAVFLRVISPEIVRNENFIIRFDLLKTILPTISHKNLVKIDSLGSYKNIYYIAKEASPENVSSSKSLLDYDARDVPNYHRNLEIIFLGVAEGLHALEKVSKSYYQEGIIHDALTFENIFISFEKSLIGKQATPLAKIDGYGESFLFFGEGSQATLQQHIAPFFYLWKCEKGKRSGKTENLGFFKREGLYPYQARHSFPLDRTFFQYSFGALIYQYLTGVIPKGMYTSVRKFNPTLSLVWDQIIKRCLSSPYGKGYSDMSEAIADFDELSKEREQLPPFQLRLEELSIPKGMALVAFAEKVELGSNDGSLIERPRFKVKIQPFFIDIVPVTCQEFSVFQNLYRRSCYSYGEEYPATMVTWHMAKAYCKWRSEKEGLPPGTYRLPTEYEWEAAARGSNGDLYPWGKEFSEGRAHCGFDESVGASQVKQYPSGKFGLYDMLGNVWEWTESPFRAHPFSKYRDKSYSAKLCTIKGGCWYSARHLCRASLRAALSPTSRRSNVGFRCARSIEIVGK